MKDYISTSLKDLKSCNAQFRDQNCSSTSKKMLWWFFFGVLYSIYDYYLFTCFSMAINSFCNLNLALSLLVHAKHSQSAKSLFSSEQDILHSAITESIRMNSHRELYCASVISLQVINSIYPSLNALSREISRIAILYLQGTMYYFVYFADNLKDDFTKEWEFAIYSLT